MKSILSITSFMVHTFDVISKLLLPCPSPRSSRFSSVLFFGSFIVWHFTLRSIIHFELIFVKDMKSVCWLFFFFFSLARGCQFKHHLLKTLSLLHCIAFTPLSQISWPYVFVGLYFWLSILFHWSISFPNTRLSWLL